MTERDEAAERPDADRVELLRVARGGGANLAGALFTQGTRFLITLLLVRLIGGAEAGLFFQAYAVLMILGLAATGAFINSATRFVALHRADGDRAALRGTVRLTLASSTIIATALAVGLLAWAPWVARTLFGDPEMVSTLRWAALALPATAFTDVALSATQGFKTMRPYASINLFFEPAARLVLTLLLVWAGLGADGAMIALAATNAAAAVLSALALRRLLGAPAAPPRYAARELFPYSAAGWFSNLASNWLLWADTILLGFYLSSRQVSIYQVASRLALLGAVVVGPLGTSFAPAAADLFRRKRFDALRRAYALVAGWTLRLYVPAFVMLVVFPRELLAIFGPGFVAGASVVVVLASAQLVNTATGPNGYLITMSGRMGVQLVLNIAALVANVLLNIWLIPRYGIEGAAASWAACIVTFTLVRVAYVRSAMDMWPLDRRFGKTVVAGLAALGAALAVSALAEDLVAVVVGAGAVLGAYAGVLALERLDEEDRLVLATLRRRLRPRGA